MQRGGSTINVISTFDSHYSHGSLSARVAAGGVAVERLGDSEVELRIAEAAAGDGGLYSCHTPSTDSVIRGTYKAGVVLTGEGPLLPEPRSPRRSEGHRSSPGGR